MPKTTTALAAFVAVLLVAMTAWADQRRVAVLQPDPQLRRAISLALSPWGLETIPISAALPRSSQPEAVEGASILAARLDVEAVVWTTRLEQGSLLWVFDVSTGDVTTRKLSETPPFDGASAAAVALSVKTVLRASVIAPPDERFGSQQAEPRDHRVSAIELGGGGHWVSEDELDFRLELAGIWWFSVARRFGMSLKLASGPGLQIDHAAYEGRYREAAVGAQALFRVVDVPGFSTVIGVGGGAHWAMLRGTVVASARNTDVDRVNGSVELETALNFRLSDRVYLGASVGAAYFPAYRRYLVDGESIFAPWPLAANLTGHCGIELF